MASPAIDTWRHDPIRWSHRVLRPIFKPDHVVRKVKSVEDLKEAGLEVIQEVGPDLPDDGYVEDEGVHEKPLPENQSCVLCIGSTGTGKSFTISTMTGLSVASNAGADSVTKRCSLYRPMTKLKDELPDMYAWIDTVGWEDKDCDDEETFKEILRFIDTNHLTSIKAIMWHVLPNVRRDALLSRQARLINQFVENNAIWDNVIIVVKQAMSLDDDSRGPLTVALDYNPDSKLQVVGYRWVDDPTIPANKRKAFENAEVRAALNLMTRNEIRKLLSDKISNIEKPFKVVFHDSYCTNCAEIGDVRLMSSYCHMAPYMAHTGRLRPTHPKGLEMYHRNPDTIAVHNGLLRNSRFFEAVDFLKGKKQRRGQRYSCCGKRAGKPGCDKKWSCCRRKYDPQNPDGCQRRYACCQKDYTTNPEGCEQRYSCCERLRDEEGCQKLCRKCDLPWGSEPRGCYKKKHNIRCLSTYGKDFNDMNNSHNELEPASSPKVDPRHSKFVYDFEMPQVIIYHLF